MSMNMSKWLAATALIASFGTAPAADAPQSWDGPNEVESKRMDAAFLLPGADFRPYARAMIDPTQVGCQKNCQKRINDSRRLSDRVDDDQARKILAAARGLYELKARSPVPADLRPRQKIQD